MLGPLVEEQIKPWNCLKKLWNIVQICTSPEINCEDIALLRSLIQGHHELFKEAYPNATIIPKHHYLIHVPDDIIR
jgi:hypothetical protein